MSMRIALIQEQTVCAKKKACFACRHSFANLLRAPELTTSQKTQALPIEGMASPAHMHEKQTQQVCTEGALCVCVCPFGGQNRKPAPQAPSHAAHRESNGGERVLRKERGSLPQPPAWCERPHGRPSAPPLQTTAVLKRSCGVYFTASREGDLAKDSPCPGNPAAFVPGAGSSCAPLPRGLLTL
uniref:Uncharacterized protein n=1 Tax=Sphaerodactylus townsendi TaxID=933632 RepID=A0ACB8EFY4_9SAUR